MNKLFDTIRKFFTPVRTLAVGFALLILFGALLLTLPAASKAPGSAPFLDALFTTTSATCVTGLVIADTYSNWTLFGQIVLICLIQVGGLGFITIGSYISLLLKKKMGLRDREMIHESISTFEISGVFKMIKRIIHGTALIEFLGAALLSIRFVPQFGVKKGLYYSLFHSISAFCNAGFDLLGCDKPYSSFVAYEGDWLVILTLSALILIGGIGFIVWDDIKRNKWHFRHYFLHTKLVLILTALLTVGGTIVFMFIEKDASLADMNASERFLGALFSSITPRTAGFNSVDTASLSPAGKLFTMFLMFIGGSPGSTAGGVKTTTLFVMILYMISMIFGLDHVNILKRRLPFEAVKRANAVVVINFGLAFLAAMILMCVQPQSFEDILFEVFSAIGTAGMTTGITRDLTTLSRIVIIVLMYFGRLGSLTFALVFAQSKKTYKITYPEEKIIVG